MKKFTGIFPGKSQGSQFIQQIAGIGHAGNSHFFKSDTTHSRQIDCGGHSTKCFVGTDIGACFLSADVLLTRLKSKDISPFAIHIGGLTYDPARKLSHHVFGRSHESKIRSTKSYRKSQWLAFTYSYISTKFSRSFKKTKGNGVAAGDQFGTGIVYSIRNGSSIFDQSMIVWGSQGRLRNQSSRYGSQIRFWDPRKH